MNKLHTIGRTLLAAITFDLAYTMWRVRNEVIRLHKVRWEEACQSQEKHSNSQD